MADPLLGAKWAVETNQGWGLYTEDGEFLLCLTHDGFAEEVEMLAHLHGSLHLNMGKTVQYAFQYLAPNMVAASELERLFRAFNEKRMRLCLKKYAIRAEGQRNGNWLLWFKENQIVGTGVSATHVTPEAIEWLCKELDISPPFSSGKIKFR